MKRNSDVNIGHAADTIRQGNAWIPTWVNVLGWILAIGIAAWQFFSLHGSITSFAEFKVSGGQGFVTLIAFIMVLSFFGTLLDVWYHRASPWRLMLLVPTLFVVTMATDLATPKIKDLFCSPAATANQAKIIVAVPDLPEGCKALFAEDPPTAL